MWCVHILQEHDSISRQHSETSRQPGTSFWRFHCRQAATNALLYNLYVFAVYTDILIIHMELNAFYNVISRNSDAKIMARIRIWLT